MSMVGESSCQERIRVGEISLPEELNRCDHYNEGDYRSQDYGYQNPDTMANFAIAVRQILDHNFGAAQGITFVVAPASGVVLATACVLLNRDRNYRICMACKHFTDRTQDKHVFLDDHMEMGHTLERAIKAISKPIDLAIVITNGFNWPERITTPIVTINSRIVSNTDNPPPESVL
jgi:hypothetical protein